MTYVPTNLVPTTELDAVNFILSNMNEPPVLTLTPTPPDELPLDAAEAWWKLHQVTEDLLTTGWFWNREVHTLTPDGSGNIILPTGTLAVHPVDPIEGVTYTLRGGMLYRIEEDNNGVVFTDTVRLRLTLNLAFTDMPPAARQFCQLKAARIFQVQEVGDQATLQMNHADETKAWSTLRAEDNKHSRRTLKTAMSVVGISGY